ncbi:MAG: LLM class flavin-dependent oxidoreductase [Hyphomicrobiales bacterium]|nr:LLM class flavin-dependent oxidoreductase [Hyphomicrobiales bacterium]MDE2016212.1 LLM class flavin-dependent oxidoreductase [Hyphomicrobiales bacterium]
MEFGLYTFVESDPPSGAGGNVAGAKALADMLGHAELADRLGLDVFALGEHHRPDYAVSAPAVALAAVAARTSRLRLSSAVTVLSSDDPVRAFQQFATLDLLSNGRAEIMAGRGSFIESFPLFGQDIDDYDGLFAEKLDLLLKIRAAERVTWQGERRPPLRDAGVYPRPLQEILPVWIAVGGTPQSVVRAGTLGLPMALAIIGGEPERFAPLAALHREAARRAGHATAPAFGLNCHGFVAGTDQEAADAFFPGYAKTMSRIGAERGWPPTSRAQYDAMRGPRGSLFVGSPATVADKILRAHGAFGHDRFLLQMALGPQDPESVARSIELYAGEVVPRVREGLRKAA